MSKSRIAKGISWAQRCERPAGMPVSRPRGGKAAGLRYERALAKALPSGFEHGPWFNFRDRNGFGYCQPDFLLDLGNLAVILECKYTWTPEAYCQMELLYVPVLQFVLQKTVIGLQVCKRLLPESAKRSKIVGMLSTGLILAHKGEKVTLHWPESAPISLLPSPEVIKSIQNKKELLDAVA